MKIYLPLSLSPTRSWCRKRRERISALSAFGVPSRGTGYRYSYKTAAGARAKPTITKNPRRYRGKKFYRRVRYTADKMVGAALKGKLAPGKIEHYIDTLIKRYAGAGEAKLAEYLVKLAYSTASVKTARGTASAIKPPVQQLSTAGELLPAYHNAIARMTSGKNDLYRARVIKSNFVAGKRKSRAWQTCVKTNGVSKRLSESTVHDTHGDNRGRLTNTFGFNQKLQMCLHENFYTVNDMTTIFDLASFEAPVSRTQKAYGGLLSTRYMTKLTNNNSYLPIYVKIKWCRLTSIGADTKTLFLDACNQGAPLVQKEGAMPLYQQIQTTAAVSPNSEAYRSTVLVAPNSSGIFNSNIWKSAVSIVKTESHKLYAGDTLISNYMHRFGPGLRIDKLIGLYKNADVSLATPITYFPLIEAKGILVEGHLADDVNKRYNGTGPGVLSCEYSKAMYGVQSQFDRGNAKSTGTEKGFYSSFYAIKIYSQDSISHGTTSRVQNYDFTKVVDSGTVGGTFKIPVMSDKTVDYTGDKV